MLVKQLKQLTSSARLRNAAFGTDVEQLSRFYRFPAHCQSFSTSKSSRRLSRHDRQALVEAFVSEYRESNGGQFPSVTAICKEVGGSFYVTRDIIQELKFKPKAPVPIVAKAHSEVSSSVANDASSQTLNNPQSHSAVCNAEHFSAVVVDPEFQAASLVTVETGSGQSQATIDFSHPPSVETNLQCNNLVIAAIDNQKEKETAPDKRETEAAPYKDVDSKGDTNTDLPESQKNIELDVCLKNPETAEEENLMHLGSKEPKADHLEEVTVSANVMPTETSQVSERGAGDEETGKKSSAWSDIMSFAKEIANFWRKGV